MLSCISIAHKKTPGFLKSRSFLQITDVSLFYRLAIPKGFFACPLSLVPRPSSLPQLPDAFSSLLRIEKMKVAEIRQHTTSMVQNT